MTLIISRLLFSYLLNYFVTLILITIDLLKRLAKIIKMSYIGKNIRKIRTVKKLSQAAFAELFSLARPSVGAYEEGRAEPKLDTVIQIANHFGISVDSLLTKELTINDLYNFNIHLEGSTTPAGQGRKAAIHFQMIKSVFVPTDKQIEYIVHLNNRDFVSGLPKILIPGHHDKNHRAFEMTGEDMHYHFQGLNIGDVVLGHKMETPYVFGEGKIYIIVVKEKIIIRRAKQRKDDILLIPDNPSYKSISIEPAAILELWEVVGYFSHRTDAPVLVSERLMHLEEQMNKLTRRLEKIEKKEKG